MPQMFPLLWLYLFILTAFLLLCMKSILYFFSKPNTANVHIKSLKFEHNWKW